MPRASEARLRGRQAEARRNDRRILEAALAVFSSDPEAPMSAIARRAEVGQASLYRRYPSKEMLLTRVCERGMARMRQAAMSARESSADPLDALAGFLHWYMDSGTPQLSSLLGSFVPSEDLFRLARETNQAIQALVDDGIAAGLIRADISGADLTLLVTQLAKLEAEDSERATALRKRYLTLILQALAAVNAPALPAAAPDADEIERPWRVANRP